MPRRTWLYIPAHQADWFRSAVRLKPDVIVADLEDGVPPGRKESARRVLRKLPAFGSLFVRINSIETPDFHRDLKAVLPLKKKIVGLLLPKIRDPREVRLLHRTLEGTSLEIVPIIELLDAEARICEIIQASSRIRSVQFGESGDYSLDLGLFDKVLDCRFDPLAVDFAVRSVKACRRASREIIDGVFLNLKDRRGLARRCRWAAELGFSGKAAIHPSQVPIINREFLPPPGKLRLARQMVSAYERHAGQTTFVPFRGSFVTLPKYAAARQFLRRARG